MPLRPRWCLSIQTISPAKRPLKSPSRPHLRSALPSAAGARPATTTRAAAAPAGTTTLTAEAVVDHVVEDRSELVAQTDHHPIVERRGLCPAVQEDLGVGDAARGQVDLVLHLRVI